MKGITNKFNVPETLLALATREYYSKGGSQYSVTELLSPPRVRRLREQYNDQIETDVTDLMWSMLGSALHVVMERGQADGHVTEERIFAEIDGVSISGQIDLQSEESGGVVITDYKFTSAWAVMNEKPEWEEQLNVYKWGHRHTGHVLLRREREHVSLARRLLSDDQPRLVAQGTKTGAQEDHVHGRPADVQAGEDHENTQFLPRFGA